MVQWFPGHMAKAEKEISEKLSLVDIVFEIRDARVPLSSANPLLENAVLNKPKLIIFMKSDMADEKMNQEFSNYFLKNSENALFIDAYKKFNSNLIYNKAKEILKEKLERERKRGQKDRPLRAMVIGIPNAGKSTFINRLVGKKVTKVGDRPGITTSQQWIRISEDFQLLDTPGVLWPKFEDQKIGFHLAITGAIKDSIYHADDVVLYLLDFLKLHYPSALKDRYNLDNNLCNLEILDEIGKSRGLIRHNEVLYERVYEVILNDFRNLYLGKITLDRIDESV